MFTQMVFLHAKSPVSLEENPVMWGTQFCLLPSFKHPGTAMELCFPR